MFQVMWLRIFWPKRFRTCRTILVAGGCFVVDFLCAATPQYQSPDISVPGASAEEPVLKKFSLTKADDYLEKGVLAWSRKRNCVTCHTVGTYVQIRPELTPILGKPTQEIHDLLTSQLKEFGNEKTEELQKSTNPAQLIYIASGLAEWDRHVAKKLSKETDVALRLMFKIQEASGTWGSLTCWPPFESSAFQEATVAAMAVSTAPGWRENLKDNNLKTGVAGLQNYLRKTEPPNDYGKVVLLWAAARMPDLLPENRRQKLIDALWSHQRKDGGWSIRTFSAPEKWGGGNRASKLRAEKEFKNPPSDGHMTGLAVLVLREAGIGTKDERLQRAVKWLLANQRESGRWWTRSLNTDKYHYITYSGTAYPLLALQKCGKLPTEKTAGK